MFEKLYRFSDIHNCAVFCHDDVRKIIDLEQEGEKSKHPSVCEAEVNICESHSYIFCSSKTLIIYLQ